LLSSASQNAASEEWALKIVLLIVGGAIGFAFSLLSDKIKTRRDPRKRLSYDFQVGSSMANVPASLTEKVAIFFEDVRVEGELFEVTCKFENTGNRVIKDQYLRFGFPSQTRILDAFLPGPPPPEIGVTEIPVPESALTDRRWQIEHLERGDSVTFGFLVSGPTATAPTVYPKNDEGDVELVLRSSAVADDDSRHVRPLLTLLLIYLFFPSFSSLFGSLFSDGVRLSLLILAFPHLVPASRYLSGRLTYRQSRPSGVNMTGQRLSNVYVSSGTGAMIVHHYREDPEEQPR